MKTSETQQGTFAMFLYTIDGEILHEKDWKLVRFVKTVYTELQRLVQIEIIMVTKSPYIGGLKEAFATSVN